MHAEEKCSTKERGLSNVKWCHLQQGLSLLYKSGTIKNIILLHAVQVISHLCFFNDKVEYPILLQAGATLPKIGARYILELLTVFAVNHMADPLNQCTSCRVSHFTCHSTQSSACLDSTISSVPVHGSPSNWKASKSWPASQHSASSPGLQAQPPALTLSKAVVIHMKLQIFFGWMYALPNSSQ